MGALNLGISPSAAAQDTTPSDTKSTELKGVEVTGSRIKRTDAETSLPVTVITRQQMLDQGVDNLGDVLRNTTFNTFGSFTSVSGNSGMGNSTVDLRGLGSDRTLILIDGHRVAPSAQLQGSGVDLNTIPLAAVERVELLTDGASAIYGSDAIGGVINIILRKKFNGAEIQAGVSKTQERGGDTQDASFVGGVSKGADRLLYGVSYTNKNLINLADRSYSRANTGDGKNFSTTSGINIFGNTVFAASDFSVLTPPAGACNGPGLHIYTDDQGIYGAKGSQLCTFNYTAIAADTTSLSTNSMFTTFTHQISDNWQVDAQGIFSHSESGGHFAPSPALLFLTADNPNNPYGQDIYVAHRYSALGPRNDVSDADVYNFLVEVKGSIGKIDVEGGADITQWQSTNFGYNYVLKSVAAAETANGDYNPFNVADPGTADTINSMKVTINRRGLTDSREAFSDVTIPLFNLPGGKVQTVVGGEARVERFYDQYDSQSEAGAVGGSAGNSSAGKREAWAVYDEMLFPILKNLEADAAVRYDQYSDVGHKVTPKVSLKYTVLDSLLLRASWGEGFRAPLLSELNANSAFSAEDGKDYSICQAQTPPIDNADCPAKQVNTYFNPNHDLKPEKSVQFGGGIVYSPFAWVDTSLDFYHIQIRDSVTTPSLQTELLREANGQPLTPGSDIVRDPSSTPGIPGKIDHVDIQTINLDKLTTHGLDYKLNGNFSTPVGKFKPGFLWTYVLDYETSDGTIPSQNVAGHAGTPRYRMVGSLDWSLKQFSAAWNVQYIPATYAQDVTNPADSSGLTTVGQGHVASYAIHDIQASYTAPWKGTLTIGMRDLFNHGVSTNFDLVSPYYDQTVYDPTGRAMYARYTQKF